MFCIARHQHVVHVEEGQAHALQPEARLRRIAAFEGGQRLITLGLAERILVEGAHDAGGGLGGGSAGRARTSR
jgi:hypothetical protein